MLSHLQCGDSIIFEMNLAITILLIHSRIKILDSILIKSNEVKSKLLSALNVVALPLAKHPESLALTNKWIIAFDCKIKLPTTLMIMKPNV